MKPEGSSFRLQDCAALFAKISSNDATTDAMLNFLIDRWEDMQKRYLIIIQGFKFNNFTADWPRITVDSVEFYHLS